MKNTQLFLTFFGLFIITNLTINAQTSYTDNKDINSLLEKKRSYNKKNGVGYRIQLYNGSESQARRVKNNFQSDFRGVYTKLLYETPDWKIQVGSYRTRLDADRALNIIKEKYNGGIIIKK